MVLDVSSEKEVVEFFESYTAEHGATDVLINNAGVTADGLLVKSKDGEISKLSLDEYQKFTIGKRACWSCPLACTREVLNQSGEKVRGPEYETVWSLGASTDTFNLSTVIEANYLCDDLGLDTISTGSVLAWYKESIDKGLVDDKWSEKRFLELIKQISIREKIGDKLADGVVEASKKMGCVMNV